LTNPIDSSFFFKLSIVFLKFINIDISRKYLLILKGKFASLGTLYEKIFKDTSIFTIID